MGEGAVPSKPLTPALSPQAGRGGTASACAPGTEERPATGHGKTGRGKTHLAIAIAYRAIQYGHEALFATAASLIDDLSSASRDGRFRDALST